MTSVQLNKELPDEFFSDILITAFDGSYGASWEWFEPVTGTDKFWLKKSGNPEHDCTDDLWLSAHVRLKRDYETGTPLFDTREGFVIDHEAIAGGISRILHNNFLNARPGEGVGGEIKGYILRGVQDADSGDIDATAADCIVQCAAFGKVIFG